MKLQILSNSPSFKLPTRATSGSAGWDLYSPSDYFLHPTKVVRIPLGFAVQVPSNKFLALLPRSSFGAKGIVVPNSMGVVDSDYRGEVCLLLMNTQHQEFHIHTGHRIGQMVLLDFNPIELEVVSELDPTDRVGGFGSTGQ